MAEEHSDSEVPHASPAGFEATEPSDPSNPMTPGTDAPALQDRALPQGVIAEALSRSRRIPKLDATGVPVWLMADPIQAGLSWLRAHGAVCRNPRNCNETPGPLRRLLKQRPKAQEGQALLIHDSLWRFESFEMIAQARQMVRDRHSVLVEEIDSEALFAEDRLQALLGAEDLDVVGLAAALWASGLATPAARELFRLLPAFYPSDSMPTPAQASAPSVAAVETEKTRHRDKRLELQAKVTELESQISRLRRDLKDRGKERTRSQTLINSLREQAAIAEASAEAARQGIDDLEHKWREARQEAATHRKERDHATSAGNALRKELDRAIGELSNAETERGAVVLALASAQTKIDALESQLAAIPRDTDAIADWLAREEVRLNEDVLTLQGGDRERAAEGKRLRRKLEHAFREAYPDYVPPRPAPIGEKRRVDFVARGGGSEVGRSCYELQLGPHKFLVDCGLAVGRRAEDQIPDLVGLERLHALLVTHAHTDHVGWIPALAAQVEHRFPIYCTSVTTRLLPIMLNDSRRHYERSMAERQLIAAHDPFATEVVEAYTRDDVYDVETRLREARMSERQNIAGTDVFATFFTAGHILGAASILIEGGGRRILFSGDISSERQHTVAGFSLPEDLEPVDLLVLESTYGDRSRDPLAVAEGALVKFVRDTVQNGIALLPSFALGRAQEVLAILARARKDRELPSDLRIVVDGMIKTVNEVYSEYDKLDPSDFDQISVRADRDLVITEASRGTPTVVVTTSGMLAGGPIVDWASRLLPNPRNRMALLGYQDEGAPGGALRKAASGRPPYSLSLRGDGGEEIVVRVAAPVIDIPLSAHADQAGLVAYARRARSDRIVLVHGGDQSRERLKLVLEAERVAPEISLSEDISFA
jgi:Cft2 family RNA processing exonuclease